LDHGERTARAGAPTAGALGVLLAFLCLSTAGTAFAASTFDHFSTGFELLGQHREVPCADCHIGGIFKGTPTACVACHTPSGRVAASAKPASHILSNDSCGDCHTATAWRPVARFNHLNVIGTCASCHTGVQAMGKTPNHMPTTADCGMCHSVTATFATTVFPPNHIPVANTSKCIDCHTSPDLSVVPSFTNIHTYAPGPTSGNCALCHTAAPAASFAIPAINFTVVGLPVNHIPTSAGCETCHVGALASIKATPVADGSKFKGSAMNHAGITSGCATCHGPMVTGATFAGVTSIIVMGPSAAPGAASHLPTNAACEACHLNSAPGIIAGVASQPASLSLFATLAPDTTHIHAGISSGCASCHESGYQWQGVGDYPLTPGSVSLNPATQYTGFQTRPGPSATPFGILDAAHPQAGDCSSSGCHGTNINFFTGNLKPANHIPTAPTAACQNCHTTGTFATIPTLTNIHLYAPSTTSNCAQCHGAAVAPGFAIAAAGFSIVAPPSTHIPTSASCESCHVGAGTGTPATPVVTGDKFTGSLMSHAGITTGCVSCHGPTITNGSFYGVTKITVMPPSSAPGAGSHIPSGTACESCHAGSTPAAPVPANAAVTAPGTLFATPIPATAMIHTGVTSGCASCHESGYQWMDQASYPLNPATFSPVQSTQYTGFQTRPGPAATPFGIVDAAHPQSGDCSSSGCHGTNTNYFTGALKPANHIPTAPSALCENCHTSGTFATLPTLTAIHANAPSTTTNCAQCHGASVVAGFAIPASGFTIVGPPATHVPTSASCESCHVGAGTSTPAIPVIDGDKFTNSLMSHAGITTGCVTCHGPTITGSSFFGISKITVMPPSSAPGAGSHIPSNTTCESCHAGSTPSAPVPANAAVTAPGTLFANPVPTTALVHAGITSGCAACHDTGYQWMDQASYPLNPSAFTPVQATQYTGFQTRPSAGATPFGIVDAAHPTSGDCSTSGCHGTNTSYFTGALKPANHIPTAASALCENCHTSGTFATLPTLTNIHANAPSTAANCAQCHGASVVAGFAIPAAGFTIVGPPANHVPITTACESCHVGAGSSVPATPVVNGEKFTGSLMSHAGITTGCVSCHGPTITGASFFGVSKIVVMPPSASPAAGSHIPSGTTCEACHAGSTPASPVPASATLSAPGTLFAGPVPTTALIHTGITSGCASCHESGYQWMDMASYPLNPSTFSPTQGTQYTGFQTRPGPSATPFGIVDAAHPTSGDCSTSGCHGTNTTYFTGAIKPANHIPTAASAVCENCHTTGTFATLPTMTNIHLYAPSTTTNCAQCHGASVVAGFAIPATGFTITGPPANHMPITTACESCHVGAGSSVPATPVVNGEKFTGSLMGHAGITTGCANCHGPSITGASFFGITKITVMPPSATPALTSHIPSNTTCETCHLGSAPATLVPANASVSAPGTLFANPVPTTAVIHTGITNGCASCHEKGNQWMDMSNYPLNPATLTGLSTTQYMGFQTRPASTATPFGVVDASHPAAGDCSACHGTNTAFFSGAVLPANHIPLVSNNCATCHTTAGVFSTVTTNYTQLHTAVATTCHTCHADGAGPFAMAAGYVIVQMSTRGKHIPITDAGVAVECSGCHLTVTAFSGTAMNHSAIGDNGTVATGNACDSCHEYGMRSMWFGTTVTQRESATHHYCAPGGTTACSGGGSDCTEGCHTHSTSNFNSAARPPVVHKPASGATTPATPAAPTRPVPRTPNVRPNSVQHLVPLVGGFDHAEVAGACASCHDGAKAPGKGAQHLPAGSNCEACHTTSAWKPAVYDHASVVAGTCRNCHTGVLAPGQPAKHVVTQLSCDSCHYTLAFTPVKPAKPVSKAPVPRVPEPAKRVPRAAPPVPDGP
jgi:hypothetical protein